MNIFIWVVFIIIVILGFMGLYITLKTVKIKMKPRNHLESDYNARFPEEWKKKVSPWFLNVEKKIFPIQSPYGYPLECMEIPMEGSNRYVVLNHGVTTNKDYMSSLAYLYHTMGFHVFAFDARAHGNSGGKTVTYGFYEKYDLEKVIQHIRMNAPKNHVLGLHGESMGAAILLCYASGVQDNCDFYIADCPYSNIYEQVKNRAKEKINLPDFLMEALMTSANLVSTLLFKFNFKKVDILAKIKRITNPVLIINCRDDDYIPPKMSQDLYDGLASSVKEIKWFDQGAHAGAFPLNVQEYMDTVKAFIDKVIA
ncbi:MAG: alpha/beta fold hydrolase [Clostridia bacterium]